MMATFINDRIPLKHATLMRTTQQYSNIALNLTIYSFNDAWWTSFVKTEDVWHGVTTDKSKWKCNINILVAGMVNNFSPQPEFKSHIFIDWMEEELTFSFVLLGHWFLMNFNEITFISNFA